MPLRHLIALIINAHPLGSGPTFDRRQLALPRAYAGRTLIRKTSLSSDRSDGVRSSSRHKHRSTTTSHAPFGTTNARVPMLGDCASITTCVTIDSRSDPTSSRCQISVSYHTPGRSLTAHAQTRNCFQRTSVGLEELNDELRFEATMIKTRDGQGQGDRSGDQARSRLVEPDGIEPTTSCLQSRRSPN